MIAKAAAISHGGNAMRYVTTKDRSDIVMVNHLPEDISPDAMYQRMVLLQKMLAKEERRGRPLLRNMIRIELSPTPPRAGDGRLMSGGALRKSSSAHSTI